MVAACGSFARKDVIHAKFQICVPMCSHWCRAAKQRLTRARGLSHDTLTPNSHNCQGQLQEMHGFDEIRGRDHNYTHCELYTLEQGGNSGDLTQ